jgi:hypothetical protein
VLSAPDQGWATRPFGLARQWLSMFDGKPSVFSKRIESKFKIAFLGPQDCPQAWHSPGGISAAASALTAKMYAFSIESIDRAYKL